MRIGLNATCFNDRASGAKQRFVGIYGELVKRLPEAEFVVYEPWDCRVGLWFQEAANVSVRRTPLPSEGRVKRFFGGLEYWNDAFSRDEFGLFEGMSLPLVKAPRGRTVLTVHDIRGVRPDSNLVQRTAYALFLERSLRAADHVITVSEAVKNEILGRFPGLPVSVIYNGLDARAFKEVSDSDLETARRKFALPGEFVLAVGHFEKRKNYPRLIEAIARFRSRGGSCGLVIVGNNSGEREALEAKVEAAGLSGSVKLLSGLSDVEVRCLYRLCQLFVFPSSYEGFGIPILEAMAAERPMVLSDIPVFREITQDKGVYFSPDDVESMTAAIETGLTSSAERARLVAYGNERVKDFSFPRLAAQVEGLYRALLR